LQSITGLLRSLEATALAAFIKESPWAFPTIESFHVIAAALVVGTIAIVDLRLLGLASPGRAFTELSRDVLPWTWGAFALAALTGVLMFISQPAGYFDNTAFRLKLLLLVCAGANMLVFHCVTQRGVAKWDRTVVPAAGRIAGALSLAFWIAVVFFGRQIGFTMSPV
jgi:hypothetical protein